MNTEEIIVVIMALLVVVALVVGYEAGKKEGKAIGWVDCYFDLQRIDRSKRDHFGRFKARNAPRHTI